VDLNNSRQLLTHYINSVHNVNAYRALPSILGYYLPCERIPALKIINLAKEQLPFSAVTTYLT